MKTPALSLALLLALQTVAAAQGILIINQEQIRLPRPTPSPPPTTYRIDSYEIHARVRDQVAEVQVSQTFVNSGSRPVEAQFVFPLPYDGAIETMTLLVDGQEFPAKLLSAEDARKQYEAIVRSQRDPALLEWVGTGMFQTNVFPIPVGASRTVNISYSQLLRKDHSLTDFTFPLSTARFTSQPIRQLSLRISIESQEDLKNIYSPTHAVTVKRQNPRQAIVTYEQKKGVPAGDFRLFFDAHSGDVNATLLSYHPNADEDGYFLLLASPEFKAGPAVRTAKTVVFVVDKSGSMSGKKIGQAREALKFVLNNLHEGDLFNIISYDSQIESFRPELEAFDDESRVAALAYVDSLHAGGGTNIHDALTQALQLSHETERPSYILFLTDGRPTSGETNESKIAQATQNANRLGTRILAFGVGYDVNSRLLDRLSRENRGLSEFVRPEEDIEAHVAKVYQRFSSPILTDVILAFELKGDRQNRNVNRMYPAGKFDLFEGEQLVLLGRYRQSGKARIRLRGTIDGQKRRYSFAGSFAESSRDQTNSFVETLWATRRIGEIIDELDLNGRNNELIEELVQLSTKHGILTPYTSFLADDNVRPELTSASNLQRTRQNLQRLEEAEGQFGFAQRGFKQQLKNAAQAPASDAATDEFRATLQSRPGHTVRAAPASAVEKHRANVRQTRAFTLYKRGQLLVTPETAALDLEKDRDRIQFIKRFSNEYFQLTVSNTRAENELLSRQNDDEELLVQLRGVNYLIQ